MDEWNRRKVNKIKIGAKPNDQIAILRKKFWTINTWYTSRGKLNIK